MEVEQERTIRAFGKENDSPSRELARAVADTGRSYLGSGKPPFSASLVSRSDRYLRGGDHSSFNREGFAAVRLTEWREDFTHQHQTLRTENGIEYGDLVKFVDFGYVARVARLNAATLAVLAAPAERSGDLRRAAAEGGVADATAKLEVEGGTGA